MIIADCAKMTDVQCSFSFGMIVVSYCLGFSDENGKHSRKNTVLLVDDSGTSHNNCLT